MKKYIPSKLMTYLTKEFFISFLIVLLVFFSLSLLVNFVEEISFFKEKKLNNLLLTVIYLSIYKTPNTLIELSIFIFLFSGILFFVKLKKNSEINTILLSGISKFIPVITPVIISFVLGIFIITVFSPISASTLRLYEQTKRIYSSNDNLIVINNTGLWFMESLQGSYNIIRADMVSDNNFKKISNITIYNLDSNFNLVKRIDSKEAIIKNKNWVLNQTKIMENDLNQNVKKNIYNNFSFSSSFDIGDLKEYFSNSNTVSFWNIASNIKTLNSRGYSADELKIKLHKYLSLPFYLVGMILISTLFTIGIRQEYGTSVYLFFGLSAAFLLYFLNDLSIAIGMSNKLPLIVSVWTPIVIIIIFSIINLFSINEK